MGLFGGRKAGEAASLEDVRGSAELGYARGAVIQSIDGRGIRGALSVDGGIAVVALKIVERDGLLVAVVSPAVVALVAVGLAEGHFRGGHR